MGTIRAPLVLGALALVLCALVAATSDGPRWLDTAPGGQQPTVSDESAGPTPPADGASPAEDQPQERPDDAVPLPWLPSLDLLLLLAAAAVLAVAVATAVRLRLLWRRRRLTGRVAPRAAAEAGPDAADDPDDAVVAGAVASGLDELRYGDPRNAIVAAWLRLEQAAESSRFHRDPADTPTEFVEHVLASYDLEREAIGRLAARYREARFSTHPVSEADREEARVCLARLLGQLRRPAVPP